MRGLARLQGLDARGGRVAALQRLKASPSKDGALHNACRALPRFSSRRRSGTSRSSWLRAPLATEEAAAPRVPVVPVIVLRGCLA